MVFSDANVKLDVLFIRFFHVFVLSLSLASRRYCSCSRHLCVNFSLITSNETTSTLINIYRLSSGCAHFTIAHKTLKFNRKCERVFARLYVCVGACDRDERKNERARSQHLSTIRKMRRLYNTIIWSRRLLPHQILDEAASKRLNRIKH